MIIAELCQKAGMPPGVFNVYVESISHLVFIPGSPYTPQLTSQRPRISQHR